MWGRSRSSRALVEVGQLVAIAILVGLGTLLVRRIRSLREGGNAPRVASRVLVAAGLVAAVVLGSSGGGAYAADCTDEPMSPAPAVAGGGHPEKKFFGPDEELPGADFAHVVRDGYVVVTYRRTLASADRRRLRRWIEGGNAAVVAGPVARRQDAIRASTAQRELRCEEFDLEALIAFRADWVEVLRR